MLKAQTTKRERKTVFGHTDPYPSTKCLINSHKGRVKAVAHYLPHLDVSSAARVLRRLGRSSSLYFPAEGFGANRAAARQSRSGDEAYDYAPVKSEPSAFRA